MWKERGCRSSDKDDVDAMAKGVGVGVGKALVVVVVGNVADDAGDGGERVVDVDAQTRSTAGDVTAKARRNLCKSSTLQGQWNKVGDRITGG
jgi:hypothetical protein